MSVYELTDDERVATAEDNLRDALVLLGEAQHRVASAHRDLAHLRHTWAHNKRFEAMRAQQTTTVTRGRRSKARKG